MEKEKKKRRRTSRLTRGWRLALAAVAVFAIVQELRKPAKRRTWHGKVADFVPYDFRPPTLERVRATYWNPQGPLLPGKVFGAGWGLNLAAVPRLVRQAAK